MTSRLQINFDAAAIPTPQRLRRWQELVGDHLADVEMLRPTPAGASESYGGAMSLTAAADVTFANVRSSNQLLRRTPCRIRRAGRETALLNIMISGECHIEQNGQRALLRPGDLCIYESVRPYELATQGAFEAVVVMVERERMEAAFGDLRRVTGARIEGRAPSATLARRFWCGLASESAELSDGELTALTTSGLDLLRIAAGAIWRDSSRGTASGSASLRRARSFMNENLARPSLSPAQIARAAGLSLRRLQELFQHAGTTITGELREMRLEVARNRLADPLFAGVAIHSVMESVGLLDQAQFSRAFRRAFGASPRDWRRAH